MAFFPNLKRGQYPVMAALTFIIVLLALGGIGLWRGTSIRDNFTKSGIIATAIRNHGDADMMHDALHADVLYAMHLAKTDKTAKNRVLLETQAHADNMLRLMKENAAVPLPPQILATIKDVEAPLTRYANHAVAISRAAFDEPEQAAKDFNRFMEDFVLLEDRMERISSLMEKSFSDQGAQTLLMGAGAQRATTIGGAILGISFIFYAWNRRRKFNVL